MEDPNKGAWKGTRDTRKLTPRKTFLMVTAGLWWEAFLGMHGEHPHRTPWPGRTLESLVL